ncbi:hypothetical protein [Qipengyuania vulgaris]|uniref:hypothetical protein n=1 Tax=Qipengyuania vulgaris TaxID=291985 RepID=UPI001F1B0B64|nr:hypothetical protein [Qipengyuania vulgaris]
MQFEPFEETAVRERIEVRFINRGDAPCVGELSTALSGEAFGLGTISGGPVLQYQLIDERQRVDITPRTGVSRSRLTSGGINLAPGEQTLELITFAVLPASETSEGTYTQNVELVVLDHNGLALGSRTISVGIEIKPSTMIGVKGALSRSGSQVRVNLGELEQGNRTTPLFVYILSTTSYRVAVASRNNGRLKHESAQWYVPYGLTMGQYTIDLDGPESFEILSRTPRKDDYPLTFEIGETENKRAGTYTDTVTFTVSPI